MGRTVAARLRRNWSTAALLFLPVAALVTAVLRDLDKPDGLIDFRIYRAAGSAVLHGHSPYASPHSILAHGPIGFVYPAPAAWAMAPFSLLPFQLAALCFTLLTTAAVVATLRVLGVRDLRCYGIALFMMPVSTAITTGTVSTLLACAAALVWRYRNSTVVPALALAAALMLKPLLWPLAIWLAATRRWRSAGLTVLAAGVGTIAGYAALHIDGLHSYPALVRATTTIEGRGSYSVYGLLSRLGLPAPLVLAYAIGAALLVAMWVLPRRDERLSFVAAIAATLALTPIMWVHYFSLLLIPLAFGSRRLSWWWAPPVLMWFVNAKPADASPASITLVWWLVLLTLATLTASRARPVRPAASA